MSDLSVTGSRFGAGTNIPGAKTLKDPEVRDTRVKAPSVARTSVPAATSYTPVNSRLSIERDEATGHYVFKSIDPNTGDVLQQYPTEKMLSVLAQVRDVTGLTVDKNA